MIICDVGTVRFQVRVAGVAIRDGRVLLARADGTDFSFLPGGRVEAGESAADAIRREMLEELGAQVRVERLVWIVENFFRLDGHKFQEMCLCFAMALPEDFLDPDSVHHDPQDHITLFWHPLSALAASGLRPAFLQTALRAIPPGIEHLVVRETRSVGRR